MIYFGYGNSSDLDAARKKICKKKQFRYVVITWSGGNPEVFEGSFNFDFRGGNELNNFLDPRIIQGSTEVIDTKTNKVIRKADLAAWYLKSLSEKQKSALIDQMLLKFLVS